MIWGTRDSKDHLLELRNTLGGTREYVETKRTSLQDAISGAHSGENQNFGAMLLFSWKEGNFIDTTDSRQRKGLQIQGKVGLQRFHRRRRHRLHWILVTSHKVSINQMVHFDCFILRSKIGIGGCGHWFPQSGCGPALRLLKTLHCLKQDSRLWNDATLNRLKCSRCHCDSCLYLRKENLDFVIIGLYANDFIPISMSSHTLS
jgi:hypothetical protein